MAISNVLSNSVIGGVKAESTKGTYNALATTDFNVKLYDLSPVTIDAGSTRVGNLADGTFKKGEYVSGQKKGSVSFVTDLVGTGDITVVPELWTILEACGMIQYTNVTAKDIKYEGITGCTGFSFDRIVKACGSTPEAVKDSIRGCAATVSIAADGVSAPVKLSFDVQGIYNGQSDIADASAYLPSSFDTGAIQKFVGAAVTIAGTAYKVTSFSFTMNGVISYVPDPSVTEGLAYAFVSDADPMIELTVVRTDVAAVDFWGDIENDTTYSGGVVVTLQDYKLEFKSAQLYQLGNEDVDGFEGQKLSLAVDSFYINQI